MKEEVVLRNAIVNQSCNEKDKGPSPVSPVSQGYGIIIQRHEKSLDRDILKTEYHFRIPFGCPAGTQWSWFVPSREEFFIYFPARLAREIAMTSQLTQHDSIWNAGASLDDHRDMIIIYSFKQTWNIVPAYSISLIYKDFFEVFHHRQLIFFIQTERTSTQEAYIDSQRQ